MKNIIFVFLVLFVLGCQTTQPVEQKEAEIVVVEPVEETPVEQVEEEPTTDLITKEELSQHDIEEDCWVGFQGDVYDISDYIGKHPGGKKGITKLCGTNEEFEDAFAGKHGNSKVDILLQEGILKGELE